MAEGLISALLEQLLSFVQPEGIGKGVEEGVRELSENLAVVQSVLFDADQKQFLDLSVRQWVEKVQDFCYDADGVLDECRTMIEKEEGEIDLSSDKVCFCIPFSCLCVDQFHRRGLRRDISCKIIELNKKLEEIAAEKKYYTFDKGAIKETQRMTTLSTSFLNESKIYGRDMERCILLEKLLTSSNDGTGLEFIPIVGMGGIGKTTLAQLAYNDERVAQHFHLRIWVYVGNILDLVSIMKAILKAISSYSPELFSLESLLQLISESIREKRLLLVLDDVWAEDWRMWESLQISLKHGAVGSKVLVTTRNLHIARMMGKTSLIFLQMLSEEFCWNIFCKLAFLDRDWEEFREVEEIGRKIVQKCKGLPLVAKTLGGLMRSKHGRKEWEAVLNHQIWELHDFSDTVFAPFLLSYYDLSPVEKLCLSYCSVFPPDYPVDKDGLIELWMSQGIFDANKNVEMGEMCFENLAMRSFFQDFKKNLHGEITSCKMHGVIHDFLQFVTRNSSFILDVSGGYEKTRPADKTTRHCTLLISSEDQIPISVYDAKKLRTLFVERSEISINSTPLNLDLPLELASLRTLCLSGCRIEKLPGWIGKLVHLRYLDLSDNSRLEEFPYELCSLLNLQTLKLNGCTELRSLPKQMGRLVNLRHLYIKGCNHLKELPKGIGRLTSLRKLDVFIVPCDYLSNNEAMKLGDLRELRHLQGYLSIRGIERVEDARDAFEAELRNKHHLVDLELHFQQCTQPRPREEEDELAYLLEALEPPSYLKSLKISSYDGATFPCWMVSLVYLRELELTGSKNCEFLPPLGKLPSLETLHICDMDKVEEVGLEFLGVQTGSTTTEIESFSPSFPRLKVLRFQALQNWRHWSAWSRRPLEIMPVLRYLEISHCRRLTTLPEFLRTMKVQELVIDNCPILEKRYQKEVGEDWPLISYIPIIEIRGVPEADAE